MSNRRQIPGESPRRRIPIEQQREIQATNQKFHETQSNLFSILYGSDKVEKTDRVQPLNHTYHDPNCPAKNTNSKNIVKLKYPKELYVYEDDPQVPQILALRSRPPREYTSMSPAELKKFMLIPPKLVIPRSKPAGNKSISSARPNVPKLLTKTCETPFGNENEDDANEFLYLYDDPDFDIGVIEIAKEKIEKEGTFDGFSLFCDEEFDTGWVPCKIIKISNEKNSNIIHYSYNKIQKNDMNQQININEKEVEKENHVDDTNESSSNDEMSNLYSKMVTIKFDNNKEKEVHRVSVRFGFEDEKRFNLRREMAQKTRKILDMECRVQSKIIKMAKNIKDPSNPNLLFKSLQMLNEEERNHPIINKLMPELFESFIMAESKFQYSQDWENPKKRKLLQKENLGPTSIYVPKLNLPGHLKQSKINSISLPDYSVSKEIVQFLMEFEQREILKEMFEAIDQNTELKKFFEELQFNIQTIILFARGQMYRKMYNLTYDMIEGKSQKKQELIMTMVDFRISTVLSNQITKILNQLPEFIINKQIKFLVSVNEVLKTERPSLDDFIKTGSSEIEKIFKTFEDNPVNKIQAEEIDQPNILKTASMENAYQNALNLWTKFFTDDFNTLHALFAEINSIIADIPDNPFEMLIEVLPKDFFTVLMKGESPIVSPEEINFNRIHDSLLNATKAINKINHEFKPIVTLKYIIADLNPFFKMINQKFFEYQQYILRYLTAYSDFQLKNLLELILSLHEKMSQPSNNVEQWHTKRCLIEHIKENFDSMNDSLNFVIKLIEFFAEFLYEANQNYSNVYEAKIKLYQFFHAISKYENQSNNEKGNVTGEHLTNKGKLIKDIEDFKKSIYEFHSIKVETSNVIVVAEKLDQRRREFERLKNLSRIYQQRDEFLGVELTEYKVLSEIEFNFLIFEPLWNIARYHNTTVEKWLSTNFIEVNVPEITDTLQGWSNEILEIKKLSEVIFDENQTNPYIINIRNYLKESDNSMNEYPINSSIDFVLKKNEELIGHIPILRELGNPTLRARHWSKISEVLGMPLDTNEGATWYWLIESEIEKHLLLVSSISSAAKMEFTIEKALQEMCEDLRTLKLKTTYSKGVMRLDDPSYALEMISKHRQRMQEIFIPPYVQPFLSKIADYEILANNLKQILKQTLEAQGKIDELQPAMESEDIKAQAPELASSFTERISQFNNFTRNFKLNISFHNIVSNQHFVEMSKELNVGLDAVKDDMKKVLEKKRQIFPRFRFLSDSQLVSIISNSRMPSMTKELFSLMYPAIKEAIIEDEQFCVGFLSYDNEEFLFKDKIWVNHNCIEKWHLLFDQQIGITMKSDLRKLIDQPLVDVDKIALNYPSQVVMLYLEVIFTFLINKAYATIESVLDTKKEQSFIDNFTHVINTLDHQIKLLHESLKFLYKPQTSNLLLTIGRQKEIVNRILKDHLITSKSTLWISTPKYFVDKDTNITVSIGDVAFEYGFDYIGFAALPLFGDNEYIFNTFSLLVNSGYTPLVCGPRVIKKTNLIFSFAHIIGKQPFVFPCVTHSSFDRIKQMTENVANVNSFIVLKDIFQLKPDVLNEINVMLLNTQQKRSNSCAIFATTSIEHGDFVTENYRVAFRPIVLNEIDIHYVLQSIFSAHGIDTNESITNKIETLIALIEKSFPPPLSSSLTPQVVIKLIREKPFDDVNNIEEVEKEIHKRLCCYFTEVLAFDDISKINPLIDQVLGPLSSENIIALPTKLTLMEHFMKALDIYAGVIVLGDPLSGKSSLIRQAMKEKESELIFINPMAIDFKELFGDTSSGLLGFHIQNAAKKQKESWIIFDGSCEDSWMDILTLAFTPPKRLSFCDGSMLNLPNTVRLIFETSDISAAAPSTLALCATIFISSDEITFDQRLELFLDNLKKDTKIFEQLSSKIIGSNLQAESLLEPIRSFSKIFIPKVIDYIEKQNMTPSFSFLHFINNYFTLLSCSILDYYYVDSNDSLNQKHNAEELIDDIPHLAMFSLFWTFAAPFSEDNRRKIDGLIHSVIGSTKYNDIFAFKRRYLSELFFNTSTHLWEEWNKGLTASLFFKNTNSEESLDHQLTEMTPMHLLIPESTLYPTLYITRILITQNQNIMFSGSSDVDKAVISDLCFRSPYAVNNLSPTTYLFQRNGTHHLLRSMVKSILPDTRSFSLRKPFLSLIDFNTSSNSSAGELIRFIIEHDFMHNTKTFAKEMTSGLRFLITTEEKEINPRLAHHAFVIQIPTPNNNARIDTLTKSIKVLWNLESNANVIASSLLSLLNEATKCFTFNIKHVFQLIHRVAVVKQNKPPEFLCEAIAHESVRVFFDPTHSEQILNKINQVTKHLSNVLNGKQINSYDISDKMLLTNFNSDSYHEFSVNSDLNKLAIENSNAQQKSIKLRFATSSLFKLDKESLQDFDPYLRMDVLRLARIVSLPRMHAFIITNLEFLPQQLLDGCQKLIGGEIHHKTHDLMKCFHNAFLKAGQTQTHQFLLINIDELNKEEKLLMMSLLHNYNVFNLFQRGEMLQILTSMYRKGASDSFGEATLESAPDYNELTSQFLVDCVTYFHWVISDHPPLSSPEFIEFSAPLQPFFATDIALKSFVVHEFKQNLIQSDWITNIEPERFEALLTAIRLNDLFQTIPYTKSYPYSLSFLKVFINSFNELCEKIEEQKASFMEIEECSEHLTTFLNDTNSSLKNMESDLVVVTNQIEESMKQLDALNEVTERQKELLEKETAVLYQQETAAAAMKKEIENQIAASKSALQSSAQELKSLSARDMAVIKGMNHPPRGVLLVVRALLLILGIDKNVKANESNSELELKWATGKKILNDPSFVSTLIDKSSNPLSNSEAQKLRIICNDENFEPSIIERSSSAAKSICKYIRSLLPYYDATSTYKSKMKEMENVQEDLTVLRQKHNEAMTKLNDANRESISLSNRQADNIRSKLSTEERLRNQRDKINHYTELYEMIEPLFNEWNEQQQEFEAFTKIASVQIIMQMFYHNWGSPLSNSKRIEFVKNLQEILKSLSIEVEPLIEYAKMKTRENDDIKALRNIFISKSNKNVYHKCRFKYPVTENWLENALMLSSDNKKWCVVEGLNLCPMTYLKQICLTSRFIFISALSPNFEEEFIHAIKRNYFVLLFDFNFESPINLVVKVQKAMKNNTPVHFHDESISIPPNFIIYFDAVTLINLRVVNLDLGYIKLGFNSFDIQERIRFSLFETTDLSLSDQMRRLEKSLLEKEDELLVAQNELKEFMLEIKENIFDNTELQSKFTYQIRTIKVLKQEIATIENEHQELMKNIGNSFEMSKEIVEMFNNNESLIKHLWKIFDRCIYSMQSFNLEKLKLLILTCYISEFGFTQIVPIICNVININFMKNDPNSNFDILKLSFDNIIQNIEEYFPTVLFNYQCPSLLLTEAKYHRPIILKSTKSIWLSTLLVSYIRKEHKCIISSYQDCFTSLNDAMRTGKILITVCSSDKEMQVLLSSIALNLSTTIFPPDFAFFIILTTEISYFPILSMCETIKVEQPLHYGATLSSLLQGLSKSVKIDFSTLSKYSLFDSAVNIFNSTVQNGSHFSFSDSIVSMEFIQRNNSLGFEEIGKYLIEYLYGTEFSTDTKSIHQIWKEVFLNSENSNEKPNISDDSKGKPLTKVAPKNASMLTSANVCQIPFSYDLESYGFSSKLDDYFKSRYLSNWISSSNSESISDSDHHDEFSEKECQIKYDKKLLNDIENIELPSAWVNEQQVAKAHIISILSRREEPTLAVSRRIEQLLSKPEIANASLLFDPVVFLKILKIDYSIQNHIDLSKITLYLSNENLNNKVKGLISIGASFIEEENRFVEDPGFHILPDLSIRAIPIDEVKDKHETNLFFKGQVVFKIKIDFSHSNNNTTHFIKIPSIDDSI